MVKNNRYQRGQSMVELIVAFFIVALVVVAVVGLATATIANSSHARNNTLARRYSQEAVEWLRLQREDNWNRFKGKARNANSPQGPKIYCLNTLSADNPGWTGRINANAECDEADVNDSVNGNSIFYRDASLVRANDDADTPLIDESENVVEAEIRVYWSDSKGYHEVKLNTQFTNW